jgi:hypothetical protein
VYLEDYKDYDALNFLLILETTITLTPSVPAALGMQGLVDVGRMGCEVRAAHSADIRQ